MRRFFSDQLLQNLLDNPQYQVANLAEIGWHENTAIGSQSPLVYVPRLREQLGIEEDRWGRMCVEHALPLGREWMDYEEFIRQRRTRMAELIRVAFRQFGGEADAPPLALP